MYLKKYKYMYTQKNLIITLDQNLLQFINQYPNLNRKRLWGNSRASKSLGRIVGGQIFESGYSRGILPLSLPYMQCALSVVNQNGFQTMSNQINAFLLYIIILQVSHQVGRKAR
jgi:hypothetical protein